MAVSETLAATGNTSSEVASVIDYSVTGTFAGTWVLEMQLNSGAANSAWATIQTGTTPGTGANVKRAASRAWRFRVSAYTSGTFVFNIQGADQKTLNEV